MKHLRWLLLVALLAIGAPGAAFAQGGDHHDPLADVSFEQRLGKQVPLDLPFVDEAGAAVRLGDYLGEKPVVLALGYLECPMLCPLVRDGMVKALSEVEGLRAGVDYTVVNVSIDPAETPMIAANTKAAIMSRLGQPGAERGWHFLTGTQDSIQRLADAVGFRYFYDETIDQYAHAAGILVLTPGGELARYFYGIEFNPSDLRLGLVEASGNKIGSPVDQLLLLCYHFDPSTGKYTGLVMTALRVAGVITVLALFALIFLLNRSSGRPGSPSGPAQAVG
ncbi:MAG: SCO family protein [Chloroflexales bacterium]|nr:SCO family protein [Chloroflexales bacterium]